MKQVNKNKAAGGRNETLIGQLRMMMMKMKRISVNWTVIARIVIEQLQENKPLLQFNLCYCFYSRKRQRFSSEAVWNFGIVPVLKWVIGVNTKEST